MRPLPIIIALALAGCAASGAVVRTKGAPVSAPATPAAIVQPGHARDFVARLERVGVVPASLEVRRVDGNPAPLAMIQIIDGAERARYVRVNELGRGMVDLYSASIQTWRAALPDCATGETEGCSPVGRPPIWVDIVPCRIYPEDDGQGWRVVCTLVPLGR